MITDEIKQILESNIKIKVNQETSALIQDGFNSVYLIVDSSKKYIFRMSDSKKSSITTKEDYHFEMKMLQFLKNKNLPVSYPLKWDNESFLLTIEKEESIKYCSLFTFAEGKPLDENDEKNHYTLGIFIAQLHQTMQNFTSNHSRYIWDIDKSLNYPVNLFKEYLSEEYPKEYQKLLEIKEWLKKEIIIYNTKIPYGLVHGDVHNFNVHFKDENSFNLFDFDFLGNNYLAFDISCFIGTELKIFSIIPGKEIQNSLSESQRKFVQGYQSIRKLSIDEIKILPLTEIQRDIILHGSLAHFCHFRGSEKLEGTDKTFKEFNIERIQKELPHLEILKSKNQNNDLYYYNELLKN